MNKIKRLKYLLIGPFIFILSFFFLSEIFTSSGAQAVGIAFWMIFWWITRPVHITVTAILPVIANAFLDMTSMGPIIAQYSSPSIILVFGACLITLPWASIGLDNRIALKALSVIGPSMKSQVSVWLLVSIFLSNLMPNVAVCAMFCPIAVSMLKEAGYDDISTCEPAVPILLAIGWGVSLGGIGSPLAGAMNLAAISALEGFTGQEFMYIDWVVHLAPFLIIATIVLLVCMLFMPMKVKRLEGTKDYFQRSYKELGPIKREEKLCLALAFLAAIGAFTRPFYADILPGLAPAYIFLTIGFICFFITTDNNEYLLTWETTEKGAMWGMMILFAGGLALGKLLNESGASASLGDIVSSLPLYNDFFTVAALVVFVRIITEVTNGTTAAAICCPLVLELTSELGLNPVPYWFITAMAYNAEFLLPISVRAIPVSYGLDAEKMFKKGIHVTLIHMLSVVICGYLFMKIWPTFNELNNFLN